MSERLSQTARETAKITGRLITDSEANPVKLRKRTKERILRIRKKPVGLRRTAIRERLRLVAMKERILRIRKKPVGLRRTAIRERLRLVAMKERKLCIRKKSVGLRRTAIRERLRLVAMKERKLCIRKKPIRKRPATITPVRNSRKVMTLGLTKICTKEKSNNATPMDTSGITCTANNSTFDFWPSVRVIVEHMYIDHDIAFDQIEQHLRISKLSIERQ
jgi:hypothetical protein